MTQLPTWMLRSRLIFLVLLATLVFTSQSANARLGRMCGSEHQEVRVKPIQLNSVAVFGELHGTQESPNFIRKVICAELLRGRRVIVGLEANADVEISLPNLDPNSAPFLEENFALSPFWNRASTSQDGRSSEAMWSLWVDLIARHLDRGDLTVVSIQPRGNSPSVGKFVSMMFEHPNAIGVILVGNWHARRNVSNNLLAGLASFAKGVGKPLLVQSYLMTHSMGSAWNCASLCGLRQLPMSVSISLKEGAYLTTDADANGFISHLKSSIPLLNEYDGFYWLGTVTASPPYKYQQTP